MFKSCWGYMNRVSLLFVVFVSVILVDQFTKIIILSYMLNNHNEISILPFLNLTLVLNSGVAFGIFREIGEAVPILFSFLAMLVAVILLIWSFYNKQSYIFAGLVAGGAVGNALDRLRLGAVVDFIDIYWQNLHWPAFNFADISISIGVVLFILSELTFKKRLN